MWSVLCVIVFCQFFSWSLVYLQGIYNMSSVNCSWILWEIKLSGTSPAFSLSGTDVLWSVGPALLWLLWHCILLLAVANASWSLLRYLHHLLYVTTEINNVLLYKLLDMMNSLQWMLFALKYQQYCSYWYRKLPKPEVRVQNMGASSFRKKYTFEV